MLILLMYRTRIRKFSVVVISILFSFGFAATQSGGAPTGMLYDFWLNSDNGWFGESGLETTDYRNLRIVVEGVSEKSASEIGLTRGAIQTRVELRLLESNLRPVDIMGVDKPYLYVQVSVSGGGFSINLSFNRTVYFDAPPVFYRHVGGTWKGGSVGTHGGSSAFILEGLDEQLDIFLRDYLTANASQN